MLIHHPDPAFNDICTFNNFIVSDENILAHAACSIIAGSLEPNHTPVFIYGPSGSGKSLLLKEVADAITADSHWSVAVLSGEEFESEVSRAVRDNAVIKFLKDYIDTDYLLLDGVDDIRSDAACNILASIITRRRKCSLLTSGVGPSELLTAGTKLKEIIESRFLCIDILPVKR